MTATHCSISESNWLHRFKYKFIKSYRDNYDRCKKSELDAIQWTQELARRRAEQRKRVAAHYPPVNAPAKKAVPGTVSRQGPLVHRYGVDAPSRNRTDSGGYDDGSTYLGFGSLLSGGANASVSRDDDTFSGGGGSFGGAGASSSWDGGSSSSNNSGSSYDSGSSSSDSGSSSSGDF